MSWQYEAQNLMLHKFEIYLHLKSIYINLFLELIDLTCMQQILRV